MLDERCTSRAISTFTTKIKYHGDMKKGFCETTWGEAKTGAASTIQMYIGLDGQQINTWIGKLESESHKLNDIDQLIITLNFLSNTSLDFVTCCESV